MECYEKMRIADPGRRMVVGESHLKIEGIFNRINNSGLRPVLNSAQMY